MSYANVPNVVCVDVGKSDVYSTYIEKRTKNALLGYTGMDVAVA